MGTAAALQRQRRHSPSSCQFLSQSRHQPIRTTAPMVSRIGKQVGQWQRRSGAAESTARAVRTKAAAARRLPSRTIAMLVSQIGWRVGLWPRRLGAAVTKARAAHQLLAGVLRGRDRTLNLIVAALAFVPSSGAQLQLSEGSD